MRIAVDAMGGDHAPREIVLGSVEAARQFADITKILLVGDQAVLEEELAHAGGGSDRIEIRHASQVVGMDEPPVQAVRRKRDSSILKAANLVKTGEADAFLSAGNTGAAMVSATLKLRTLEAVERPAIAAVMPTPRKPFVLVDAGANTDCTAELLRQFAVMGCMYARVVLGREDPVVGLLSIGGEEIKGNETTREAFKLLSESPMTFRGNVEGHDLFIGETDVVVCDGFVGNVVLKTTESVSVAITKWMKQEFTRTPVRMAGAALLSGAVRAMKRIMDPELYGGAPLLGVNGICIITHGASSRRAIFHAVRVARELIAKRLNELISSEIRKLKEAS